VASKANARGQLPLHVLADNAASRHEHFAELLQDDEVAQLCLESDHQRDLPLHSLLRSHAHAVHDECSRITLRALVELLLAHSPQRQLLHRGRDGELPVQILLRDTPARSDDDIRLLLHSRDEHIMKQILSQTSNDGRTPLLTLCASPHMRASELAPLFLGFGAHLFGATDHAANSALHILCANPALTTEGLAVLLPLSPEGLPTLRVDLLPKQPACAQSTTGFTALHLLAKQPLPNLELLRHLLAALPELGSVVDASRNLAVMYLARNTHITSQQVVAFAMAHSDSSALAKTDVTGLSLPEVLLESHSGKHSAECVEALRALFVHHPALWWRQERTGPFFRQLLVPYLAAVYDKRKLAAAMHHITDAEEARSLRFALCICVMLGCDARADALTAYDVLFSIHPSIIKCADAAGDTLLHHAASIGDRALCERLRREGANPKTLNKLMLKPVSLPGLAAAHFDCWSYLNAETQRMFMFRGRFDIDDSRLYRTGHSKVVAAFDKLNVIDVGVPIGATASATSHTARTAHTASATTSSTAHTSHAATQGKAVMLKFFTNEAEFLRESAINKELSALSRGGCLPAYVDQLNPVVVDPAAGGRDAAEGLDEDKWVLVSEAAQLALNEQLLPDAEHPGRNVPWTTIKIFPLLFSVACALEFVHTNKYVHCDIKAENVVKQPGDSYVLVDFGSARKTTETLSDDFTAHYCPPEQAKRVLALRSASGHAPPAPQAHPSYDSWSLGVLIWYVRTGQFPFDVDASKFVGQADERRVAILERIVEEGAGDAKAADERLAARLKDLKTHSGIQLSDAEREIISHLMRRDPAHRWSMKQLREQLETLLRNLPSDTQNSMKKVLQVVSGMQADVAELKADVKVGFAHLGAQHKDMLASLATMHSMLVHLQKTATDTLDAVFAVESAHMPRLFILLPDHIRAEREKLASEEAKGVWKSLKSLAKQGVMRAEEIKRTLSMHSYWRLTFLCEAHGHQGECQGVDYIRVNEPKKILKSLLPALRLANTLLGAASAVGKSMGYPIPDEIPFVNDIHETGLWSVLDEWHCEAEREKREREHKEACAAAKKAGKPAPQLPPEPLDMSKEPDAAYGLVYAALTELLKNNGATPPPPLNAPMMFGLTKVQGQDSAGRACVKWVCGAHAKQCFGRNKECTDKTCCKDKADKPKEVKSVAAAAAATPAAAAPAASVGAVPAPAPTGEDPQVVQLRKRVAELELSASQRQAPPTPSSPSHGQQPSSSSAPTKAAAPSEKKSSACVVQ
jgi:ankyrin repeat protein